MATLSNILTSLIIGATRDPGKIKRAFMPRGLVIMVCKYRTTPFFYLAIGRKDIHPQSEWETVLKYWPWQVEKKDPTLTIFDGYKCCAADMQIDDSKLQTLQIDQPKLML